MAHRLLKLVHQCDMRARQSRIIFEDGGCPPSLNFKIEIFNSCAFQRHVLCHLVKFYGDRSYFRRNIAVFFCIFLVKCKNSLDDLSYYGITLSKLEILEYNFVILHRYEHTIGDISCWENIIQKF